MIALFIGYNNIQVDLSPDSVVSLNYELNNKENLSSYTATYSSSLEIPMTDRNKKLFRLPDMVNDTDIPSLGYEAIGGRNWGSHSYKIMRNGDLADSGKLVINKVGSSVIYCNLFSDLVDIDTSLSSVSTLGDSYHVETGQFYDTGNSIVSGCDVGIAMESDSFVTETHEGVGEVCVLDGYDGLLYFYAANLGKPSDFDTAHEYDGNVWNEKPETIILGSPVVSSGGVDYYQYRVQQLTPVVPSLVLFYNLFNRVRDDGVFRYSLSTDARDILKNVGLVGPRLSSIDGCTYKKSDSEWVYFNDSTEYSVGKVLNVGGLLDAVSWDSHVSSKPLNLVSGVSDGTKYVASTFYLFKFSLVSGGETYSYSVMIAPSNKRELKRFKQLFPSVSYDKIEKISGSLQNLQLSVDNPFGATAGALYCSVHTYGVLSIWEDDRWVIRGMGMNWSNSSVYADQLMDMWSEWPQPQNFERFYVNPVVLVTSAVTTPSMSIRNYFNAVSDPWGVLKKIFKKYNIRLKLGVVDRVPMVQVLTTKEYYGSGIKDITGYVELGSKIVHPHVYDNGYVVFAEKPVDTLGLTKASDIAGKPWGSYDVRTNKDVNDSVDWFKDKLKYCHTPNRIQISTGSGIRNVYCIAEAFDSSNGEVDLAGCLVDISNRGYQGTFGVAITDNLYDDDHSECYFSSGYLADHSNRLNVPKLHTTRAIYDSGGVPTQSEELLMFREDRGMLLYTNTRVKDNLSEYFADVLDSTDGKRLVIGVFMKKLHMTLYEFVTTMWWFENANWVVGKVTGYNPDSESPTEVEFIRVNDIANYFESYTVNWDAMSHGSIVATVNGEVVTSGSKFIKGTEIVFTVTTDEHYHLDGWSDAPGNRENPRTIVVTGDATYGANISIDAYIVEISFSNGYLVELPSLMSYTTSPARIPVGYDRDLTVSFIPNEGYGNNVQWSEGGTVLSRDSTLSLTNIVTDHSISCESYLYQYGLTLTSVTNVSYEVAKKVGTSWVVQSAPYVFDYGTELRVTESSTHGGYEPNGWVDDVMDNPRYLTLNSNVTLKGRLKVRYFTVSCTANNCSVSGTGSKAYGSVVTLVATPSAHYKIESDPWTNKPSGATVSADYKTLTFSMPSSNVSNLVCTAVGQVYSLSWSGANQNIVVKVNGSTVTDNPHDCTYPSTVQVTSTPVPTGGYSFTRWIRTSGSTEIARSTSNPYSFSIDRATGVIGVVTEIPYNTVSGTLTHATIDSGLGSHAYGSTVRVTASADTYYELYNGSWTLTCGSSSVAITSHASDWSWVEFVQPVGNVTVNITTRRYTYSFMMSVTAGTGTITGSYTYEGTTYNLVDGTTYQVPAGISIAMIANPSSAAHYVFNKWSDGETNRSRTVQVTSSITYYASFKLEQFKVNFSKYATYDTTTVSATAGGVAISSGAYVDYGKTVIITCNPLPSDKYSFTSWKSGSTVVSTNATYTINSLSSAVNVVAYLGVKTYALTVSGVNCAVSGAGTYEYGTTVVVSATPNSHYHWGSWSDGGAQSHSVTITGAKTLTATCVIDTHTLTLVGNHCTVTGGGTYNYGTVVTVNVSAIDSHYHWGSWSDGGARQHTVTVDSTKTLTATAAIDTHTVTLYQGTGCKSVSGAGTYNYGTSVNISAAANDYYQWGSWDDGNTSNPRAITVNGDKSYTANFVKTSYKLTLNGVQCTITGATSGSSYQWGTSITLTATPATGYHFISSAWSVPSGVTVTEKTVTSSSARLVFVMPKSTVTIGCSGVVDTATITYNTYLDDGTAKYWAGDLTYSGGNVIEGGAGHSYAVVETTKGNSLTVTAKTDYGGYTFLGWYTAISGGTLVTSNASMTQVVDGTVKRYTARYSVSSYVTFSSGSYLQVGTKKRFGFVISDSSAGLYSNAISIEVHRRRTGVAEETIATGSITLSSSGTYTQLPSTTFQATDSYTDATYYIYAYKDGTFLGSVECEEQVSNSTTSEE